MPQRRGHVHARQRDDGRKGAVDDPFLQPAVERRIVTIYTTLTSSGWAGGDLTTVFPSPTLQDKDGSDTKKTTSDKTEEDQKTMGGQVGEPTSSSLSYAPIEASTAALSMASGPLVAATEDPTTSSTLASSTASSTPATTAAASETSASATSAASTSSGSNDVATKAGIALGVLGGLLVVLGAVYFIIMRRRKQLEEQRRMAADDEKLNGPFEDGPAPAAPAKAPRLSLRPVTGLFTSFHTQAQGDQRAGANLTAKRAPGASAWESHSDRNPFGNGAERIPEEPGTPNNPLSPITPISEVSTQVASPEQAAGLTPAPRAVSALTTETANAPRISAITMDSATVPPMLTRNLPLSPSDSAEVSPIESADDVPVGRAVSSPEPTPAATYTSKAALVATGAAAGATLSTIERHPSERRQSVRKENVPAPLDLTLPPKMPAVPPSPVGTEFSFHEVEPDQSPIHSSSAAAIAAAGGPPNSTVHRVQLDFNPSLDDEMALQAGQVVRLLHEYDDGWALCIRLDRSQQGVVPRTCLSTRPVKPRTPPQGGPRGPPVNPQGRPRGPSVSSQRGPGPNYHPQGPGQRGPAPVRPTGPPMSPIGRPMSPGMGPGPRPQSPNGPGRKPNPPGPSNRQQEYRPSLDRQPQNSAMAPGQAY